MAGRRRSKEAQKNVSVYLGRKGEWPHQMLQAVCRHLNVTESELFRDLFFEQMARWRLYDADKNEPVIANIERLSQQPKPRIPKSLVPDQEEP
jgi:hypothetical protein